MFIRCLRSYNRSPRSHLRKKQTHGTKHLRVFTSFTTQDMILQLDGAMKNESAMRSQRSFSPDSHLVAPADAKRMYAEPSNS